MTQSPAPGLLAHDGSEPLGWVRLGPIDDFARVTANPRRRTVVGPDPDGLWAITCFVVPPAHRRSGVATALVDGAIAVARDHDAAVLEGHPVDTTDRRVPAAELYHGVLSTFLAAGFTELGRTGPYRPVVRLPL